MYGVFHLSQGKWFGGGTNAVVGTCLQGVTEHGPMAHFPMEWDPL